MATYNLVSRWKRNSQSLSTDYSCDVATVMIMFPYSESFNTPPGIEGRVSTLLIHWGEKLGMASSSFKDVVICRRGNIKDGLLSMVLADIVEDRGLLRGMIRLTFAQRSMESDVESRIESAEPIDIIRNIVKSLGDTYRGLPMILWSVCSQCGEKIAPWNDENSPPLSGLVECGSCRSFVQSPNLSYWPRSVE